MPKLGPGEEAADADFAAMRRGLPPGLRNTSDEALVAAMARGSEAAFEVFYERHRLTIRALCRRVLGSNADADDALQEAMASIWWYLRRAESQPPKKVRAWMYAVARNRCLAMLETRQPEAESELANLPASVDLGEEVERRMELRALLRDVDDLPVEQRSALVLSELGGLSHADVANVLGRHPSSIRTLVFQARSRLGDWKVARDLPCREVRRQLIELKGGALRRRTLHRHLQLCDDCRAWRTARAGSGIRSLIPLLPGLRWLANLIPGAPGGLLAPLGVVAIGTPLVVGGAFHGHQSPRAADPAVPVPALTAAPSTSLSALTFSSFDGGPRPVPGSHRSRAAIPSPLVVRSSSGALFSLAPARGVTVPGYRRVPTPWAGFASLLGVAPPPATTSASTGPPASPASAATSASTGPPASPASAATTTTSTSGSSATGSARQPAGEDQGDGGGQNGSGQSQGQGGQGTDSGGEGDASQSAGSAGSGPASVAPGRGHAHGTPPPGHTRSPSADQQSTQDPSASSGQGEQSQPGLHEPAGHGHGVIPPAVPPTPPAGGLRPPGSHGGGPPLAQGGPLPPGHGRSPLFGRGQRPPDPNGNQ
jgi:RNA polymerase sigma factor (sigma-70 family)